MPSISISTSANTSNPLKNSSANNYPDSKKFEAKTSSETSALKATITHSEQAIEDIHSALKLIPKTEKKSR